MTDKILVLNSGSSSLKFSLYDKDTECEIVKGNVERIGSENSFLTLKYDGKKLKIEQTFKDIKEAIVFILSTLKSNNFISDINEIKGVGHRVLHGGEYFYDSVLIDDDVLNKIDELTKFGPLHHPSEIAGIKAVESILPEVPNIAVFDTAFHQTIPVENFLYPVPEDWYKTHGVRKYGFHGTSHKYITEEMKKHYNKDDVNLIICHIGSGASISCIKDGKCYDTSMGLTPLDGLVMRTRSGSIDPSIIEYMVKEANMNVKEVNDMLNNKSGLLAIAGVGDFRDILDEAEKGNHRAILANRMLENSIIKYISNYYFELEGKVDAIVFTAGIGENSKVLRESIINRISNPMQIYLNKDMNDKISNQDSLSEGVITTPNSKFDVIVKPTNEEKMILNDTIRICKEIKANRKVLIKK